MFIITCNIERTFSLENSFNSVPSLSLIRLWGKVVYNVEKSYVDRLAARNPLDLNLFITSHEFLIDQKRFLPDLS